MPFLPSKLNLQKNLLMRGLCSWNSQKLALEKLALRPFRWKMMEQCQLQLNSNLHITIISNSLTTTQPLWLPRAMESSTSNSSLLTWELKSGRSTALLYSISSNLSNSKLKEKPIVKIFYLKICLWKKKTRSILAIVWQRKRKGSHSQSKTTTLRPLDSTGLSIKTLPSFPKWDT